MTEKRCYTVQELQEILGVSRPTIYNLYLEQPEAQYIQFLIIQSKEIDRGL